MMRYHMGWETTDGIAANGTAGKMLRPTLCLLACEAVGGAPERAIAAAAAIELLHNFSLVHDDIEDRSDERHGRATVWRIWGDAQAINVGDGMFALAYKAMLELGAAGVEPKRVLKAIEAFDAATLRLCEGQNMDMAFETRLDVTLPEYFQMISGKTAALMGASTGLGALAGGADNEVVAAMTAFGEETGKAFQVFDDYLGIWGDPEKTGKPVHDDIRSRKKSYPVLHCMEHANGSDASQLRRMYSDDHLGESEIISIVEIIERTGSAQATLDEARSAAERARQAIDAIALDSTRKSELLDLLDLVVDRTV
jgi:geranylgeranyl diphosphate synthase, type I